MFSVYFDSFIGLHFLLARLCLAGYLPPAHAFVVHLRFVIATSAPTYSDIVAVLLHTSLLNFFKKAITPSMHDG